jgi:hypothetical protein
MRLLILIPMSLLIISCNSGSKKQDDKQKQIDSLTNALNKRQEEDRQEQEAKGERQKLNAVINERNEVLSKVTTDQPAFDAVTLGGFKNIRFNFFNDYKYELEQVILKVHYIKADRITEIKTETIILNNIAANSRQALNAPDYTAAGTYLTVTIETVLCKAIDLCYYSSKDITGKDPFKCK